MLKNVYLIENIENLCLWFFSILKAVYKFSLPLNMCWIRKRCPHLPENKLCHSQFYESDNKTLKLKVLKNLKICAFDFFYCEPIFDVIRISNSCVYQKTLPAIFEKKAFVAFTSVSLKIHLESRKWPRCPAPGAPGLKNVCFKKIVLKFI